MKTLTTTALRGCLLAVAAFAIACGGNTASTTSGTAGLTNGGSTSGGTTGCFSAGVRCPNGNGCCSGLTCDTQGFCTAQSNGTSGGSTGGTTTGGLVNPCPLGAEGAACGTAFDCQVGMLCVGGLCTTPNGQYPQCTPQGTSPSAGDPCCQTDDNGACVSWEACINQGGSCSDGGTCCNGTTCGTDGNCDAICLAQGQTCTQDTDCCENQGLLCADGSIFTPPFVGKVCAPIFLPIQAVGPTQPGYHYFCQADTYCAAYDAGATGVIECQLDASCNPADGGNPCAQEGLICDPNGMTCRNPDLFDQCILGGPACNPVGGTTSPTVCSPPVFGNIVPISLCTFACQDTTDCALPYMFCETNNFGPGPADICVFNIDNSSNDPTRTCTYNGVCGSTAPTASDGICLAVGSTPGNPQIGVCLQALTDGDGGTGAACSIGGNRQNGGLCDTQDVCVGDLCTLTCNAGTAGGIRGGCGAGLDCAPLLQVAGTGLGPNPTVDADTAGACVTPCDFTVTDGGACGLSAQGLPTKCYPAEAFGYAVHEVSDFCVAGPGALGIPVGADCSNANIGSAIDPCVDGAACFGNGTNSQCRLLCEDGELNKKDVAGGCPTGFTCTAGVFLTAPSTHTGICVETPDGG